MKKTIKKFEHLRITGRMDEHVKALNFLEKGNWRVVRIGPRVIGPGRADVTRLVILAEREVK